MLDHTQGVCVVDGVPSIEPPASLAQSSKPVHAPESAVVQEVSPDAPRSDLRSYDSPMSDSSEYEEHASTSGESEATCHSAAAATWMAASGNVVRLVPVPNYANRPLLHMKCVLRQSDSRMVVVQTIDGPQVVLEMTDVLQQYSGRLESVHMDATALSNPKATSTMVPAIALPFAPSSVAFLSSPLGPAPSIPCLPALRDLSITASRAISVRSLLEFLHYCPMLRTLALHNSRRHASVYPESIESVAAPHLPYLEHLTVDGLLTGTVEALLDKLHPSLKEGTHVDLHFYGTGFPVLQHGPALQKLFASTRHGCLFYMSNTDSLSDTTPEAESQQKDLTETETPEHDHNQHLLSFSDIPHRVQLFWHWKSEAGVSPNLAHIGLVSPAFATVRTLSLFLRGVQPSYYDLLSVLQSFKGLRRIELSSTSTPPARSPVVYSHQLQSPAHLGLTTPESDSVKPTSPANAGRPEALSSKSFTTRYRVFAVRAGAARVLRRVTNVPLLFAVELAQAALTHSASSFPSPSARSRHGPAPDDAFSGPAGAEPGATPATAQAHPLSHIPAHMRRLVRYYYDPLWALMVRTA
ncbi:hypothetical protein C8Q76DRAFT_219558 [Earliella scabrosa]|nr:hypothetical protein C8Q76DRAFT_219558 [Earliella scabrosa]